MRGIATIDRQQGSDTVMIWLTKRTEPLRADHTNSVGLDLAADPRALEKMRCLTRACVVLATEGSVLEGLPIEGEPLAVADIDALVAATEAHQRAILEAVSAYKRRARSANLKEPTFPKSPSAEDFAPSDDSPAQRTLSTANYAARAWTAWLRTDEERRRRTIRPRTGESPWMMPEALSNPGAVPIPPTLSDLFHEQPLV